MKSVRAGAVGLLTGLTVACASQMQSGEKVAARAGAPSIDINLSNDLTHRYGESQIALNPKNPNNIIVASLTTGYTYACLAAKDPNCDLVPANLVPGAPPFPQARGIFFGHNFDSVTAFVSQDRGKTWTRATIPIPPKKYPHLTGWGDPSITATSDGTFYLSFDLLDWGTPEKALPAAGIGVSKSTDGGKTWSDPELTGTPADGPKITSDPTTSTVYIASSTTIGPRATGDPSTPPGKVSDRWIASSKDGVHWTSPHGAGGGSMHSAAYGLLAMAFKTISPGQGNLFGAPNSELCGSAPAPCTIFQTTTDAAATWTRHVMSVPSTSTGVMVAADPAKKGHFAVALLIGNAFHVYQTSDAGNTWTGPTVVTDDASKQHYHSWMAYSPNGVLGIMSRTRQPVSGQAPPAPAPGGFGAGPVTPYNVWAAISRDGGATFSEPLKVSSADSPAPQGGTMGNSADDYSSITLDREYAYVSWADWRPGERSAFFRAIKLDAFKQK